MPKQEHTIVVAQGEGLVGKRYVQLDNGAYVKAQDFRGGEKDANVSNLYRFKIIEGIDSLEKLYSVRKALSLDMGHAFIQGQPTDEAHDAVNEIHDDDDGTSTSFTRWLPRSEKYLVDGPSYFFTLDLDELTLDDYNAVVDIDSTPERLFEIFDDCGLDWLITDCIIHYSSSHGLISKNAVKAHITYQTEKPLTLAQQHAVAGYINEKAKKYSNKLVDTAIYEPRRLLFTSRAEVYRVSTGRRVKAPTLFDRVRYIRKGESFADVPAEATKYVDAKAHIDEITGIKTDKAPEKLAPGNVYSYVRARVHAVVASTPSYELPAAKLALKEELLGAVRALPDHEEKRESRESRAAGRDFDRLWRDSVRKFQKRSARTVTGKAKKYRTDVTEARQELADVIKWAVDEAITARMGHDGWLPRVPTHTLFKSPPGMGKSEQAMNALRMEYVEDNRILLMSPTAALSTELHGRLMDKINDESLVRLHLGRAKWCDADEATQQLATEIEQSGLSPKDIVCKSCDRHDVCPWPKQREDVAPGVVVTQHANLSSTYQNMKAEEEPAMTIIDEAVFNQVIPTPDAYKTETLNQMVADTTVIGFGGKTNNNRTADLMGARRTLVDALTKTSPRVMLTSLSHLLRPQGRSNLSLLRQHQHDERSARAAWMEYRQEVGDKIKEAGTSAGYQEELKRAARSVKTCDMFIEAVEIIMTSHDVPGRDHVFGMEYKSDVLTMCRRKPLPDDIMTNDMVFLDGTADEDVFRACVRDCGSIVSKKVVKTIDVHPEHYVLTQCTTMPFGKSAFLSFKTKGKRDDSNLKQMYNFILSKARQHKTLLVVAQLEVKEALRDLGPLPDNVSMEHFNALRGRDEYRDHEAAIIVGRPAPPRNSVELLTEALHIDNDDVKDIVQPPEGFYGEPKRLPMKDGTFKEIPTAESHPDPHVRSMMRQLCDAEVVQAVGRLRLYDRTPDTMAYLYVFGQIDTGLMIDHHKEWNEFKSTSAEQVGIITQSRHLCDLIGERVGRSGSAVRKQLERPYGESSDPLYKLKLNGKLVAIKIGTPEEVPKLLGDFGEISDVRKA